MPFRPIHGSAIINVVRWTRGSSDMGTFMFRTAVLACVALLLTVTEWSQERISWFCVIAGFGLVRYALMGRPTLARAIQPLLVVEAGLAVAGALDTPPQVSPLLVLLIIAPLEAAVRRGVQGLLLVVTAQALTATYMGLVTPDAPRSAAPVNVAEWILLGLAVGGVVLVIEPAQGARVQWQRAQQLIDELGNLTEGMPSLDAGLAAEELLAECAELVPVRVGAVLRVGGDGLLVPLAVRGAANIPWKSAFGTDIEAWKGTEPYVDRRPADLTGGRRQGSALLIVPLCSHGTRVGAVVLDSTDVDAYGDAEVELIRSAAALALPRLKAAFAFEVLRRRVLVEERERLAREMHDGVAQEIAAIGFEVHRLERWVSEQDTYGIERVQELNGLVDRLSSGVRLAMIDLRASVGPHRGLLPSLSTYLRSVQQATGMDVTIDLQDSGFRLDGHIEETLFRVVHECIGWLRHAGCDGLSVAAIVDPPQASVTVSATTPVWNQPAHRRWLEDQAGQHGLSLDLDDSTLVVGVARERQEAA